VDPNLYQGAHFGTSKIDASKQANKKKKREISKVKRKEHKRKETPIC